MELSLVTEVPFLVSKYRDVTNRTLQTSKRVNKGNIRHVDRGGSGHETSTVATGTQTGIEGGKETLHREEGGAHATLRARGTTPHSTVVRVSLTGPQQKPVSVPLK